MATRKLQTEIDKVLKKVAEGIETFEETLEKIETTTNANQKEKYESDLKKDIKKLQRQRDQIKTWISSNDIKDKRVLMENRKLIEQQMEKFKVIEKEMKTKAYSREGLIMSGRLDPKEKEQADLCAWVTERVEALNIQIESMEAEAETLQIGAKKGKANSSKERITELEEKIERHKWHQGRLELILRLLENGQIDIDKVTSIQEDVNYYVDENADPDFAEDEEIYTDLNLEEEEDFYVIGADDHHKDDDASEKSKDEELPVKKYSKIIEQEPAPSPAKAAPAKPTPIKKLSVSEPKEAKPVTLVATTKTAPVATNASTRQTAPARVDPPTIQYAAAAAANLPMAENSHINNTMASSQSSSLTSTATVATGKIDSLLVETEEDVASKSESLENVTTNLVPNIESASGDADTSIIDPTLPANEAQTQPVVSTSDEAHSSDTSPVATKSTEISSTQPSRSQSPNENYLGQDSIRKQQPAPSEPEIRLPSALADLAHSFEISKERALTKDAGFFGIQMLETSFQYLPEPADTERHDFGPKYYSPKNPYPTPSYYPQMPPPALFESPTTFEKFDIDTYLAARELKKQSWRFHKKYLTWFQRHEEPKAITDDYEQGTYVYFDYEGAWCQRKKTDFRFEYKFLEDELV
ncbi:general negative regulator of transcription subunit 5 [Linnemannia zychae]|nr:general negative regulator of transcription subunit 5 [Linnemannia zychae]